jgi:hypothetical protein
VLEFLMPILNSEKPKRISLTMANTLFSAISGVRPVNLGLLIHEVVARAGNPLTSPHSSFTSTGVTNASRRMRRTC